MINSENNTLLDKLLYMNESINMKNRTSINSHRNKKDDTRFEKGNDAFKKIGENTRNYWERMKISENMRSGYVIITIIMTNDLKANFK